MAETMLKGSWWPEMPPAHSDEDDDAYTDRLLSPDSPYDHHRNRQCSIGYHDECSDPRGERCECPCHRAQELHIELTKVTAELAEQEGVMTLAYVPRHGWTVSLVFGREAPDSPMAGGAAYGTGDTLMAALQKAVDETGWK